MLPFNQIDKQKAVGVRYILTDIDDTITTDGKLTAEAYAAMWRLHDAGFDVIPVTGRPAGWCDMIARQWPVKAVVGENGAFVYYFENNMKKTFTHPSVASGDIQERLESVKQACLSGVPGCRVAKDQFSRIYDIAIDFNEDPPRLGFAAADNIRDICLSMGAQAKVSSIHVNAWHGSYDKLSMAELFMREILRAEKLKETVLFFGDSPNDEPMFEYFPNSCAVANIRPFIGSLKSLPTYVTDHESGKGFAEAVSYFLQVVEA